MPRCIDADALKDVIRQHDYPLADKLNSIGNGMFTPGIFQAIDAMPTVSPDEVRGVGRWIWHDNYGWDDSLECSCCAEEFFVYDGEFPGIDSFKFCPNCGARMGGVQDALP